MKKICDFPYEKVCRHPDHNPPSMIVLDPGVYEHTCPKCGERQTVVVRPKPTLSV